MARDEIQFKKGLIIGTFLAGYGTEAQCEAARTLLHFARLRGRTDLYDLFEGTMVFCLESMVDDVYGGWYIGAEGAKGRESDKGSHWKVDYHAVALCVEAMRLL